MLPASPRGVERRTRHGWHPVRALPSSHLDPQGLTSTDGATNQESDVRRFAGAWVLALPTLLWACSDESTTGQTADGGAGSGAGSAGGGGHGATTASGGQSAGGGDTGGGGQGTSSAAELAAALGKPAQLLFGLGAVDQDEVEGQELSIDFFERYLVGLSDSGGWQTWNTDGTYVDIVAAQADALGAVPMYTLYQMATWGDGNLAGLSDSGFMTRYWDGVRTMFERLASYDQPAVVHVEPDFWGYVMQQAPSGDPAQLEALVTLASECSDLPNDVTGMAGCIIRMGRQLAPKARLGFSPSRWGTAIGDVITFMTAVGAGATDVVIMQTLDRDAGCFEANGNECTRDGEFYWDETNTTSPNFGEHLAEALQYHEELGKPLLWWQTPLGVPSTTPGGTAYHYRDNRVHYLFAHPAELVGAGALGVVFSPGQSEQTNITTDGGQFQQALIAYAANPTALP